MSHGFDKYELPSRVALVLSYYAARSYETSDDVLADRKRLIAMLDAELAKSGNRMRLAMQELRRDLVAGYPRGSVTADCLKKMGF
jgi:hypothetical protein